nr:sulfatase-like hydrolase/transferase [Flavobacterium foetidum]
MLAIKLKKIIISLISSFFVAINLTAQQNPSSSSAKPNIVFILMDNLGYGEVGCYGGGEIRGAATPRIDKLAAEGTRLTNFNVEAQCTPSRSAILPADMPFVQEPTLCHYQVYLMALHNGK